MQSQEFEFGPVTAARCRDRALDAIQSHEIDSAIAHLENAVALEPTNGSWLVDLGTAYAFHGSCELAVPILETALRISVEDSVLCLRIARALRHCGAADSALDVLSRIPVKSLEYGDALCEIGSIHAHLENWNAAAKAFFEAKELEPLNHAAWTGLATAWTRLRFHSLALNARWKASQLLPNNIDAAQSVVWASISAGTRDFTIRLSRKLIEQRIIGLRLHSAYLSTLLHDGSQTVSSLLAAHEEWADVQIKPLRLQLETSATVAAVNDPDPERKLRIGYLGGEFWRSPGYHCIHPAFSGHDKSRFHISVFDKSEHHDEGNRNFEALSDAYYKIEGMSGADTARLIREARIDILVDVSGHYLGHILEAFVHRPAPIQLAFPTYPATTGMREIDYIITDRWVCPEVGDLAACQYTETPCFMPSGYLAYEPPQYAPDVSPLPALSNGFITFGIFQRPSKYTDQFWDTVAEVLKQVPESRLLIHFSSAELDLPHSELTRKILAEFERRGIERGRVHLRGVLCHDDHFSLVSATDICLDTFPYNGQTTTCECLWMGVPVVTLIGDYHVARVGWELLDRVGLPELAAIDLRTYMDTAISLANDVSQLQVLREGMRERLLGSPLLQSFKLTAELEAIYRELWRRNCSEAFEGKEVRTDVNN